MDTVALALPIVRVNVARDSGAIPIQKPNDVVSVLRRFIPQDDKEHFVRVDFDNQGRISGIEMIATGVLDSVPAGPRETFRGAILNGASAIVIAHNHPSGSAVPSKADHGVCERMRVAGEVLGITVLDAIIIGEHDAYSIRGEKFIDDSFDEWGVNPADPKVSAKEYEDSPAHISMLLARALLKDKRALKAAGINPAEIRPEGQPAKHHKPDCPMSFLDAPGCPLCDEKAVDKKAAQESPFRGSPVARLSDPDFDVERHGMNLTVVQPLNGRCREWLEGHTDGTWFGGGLVVEPRYVADLVRGMIDAGFTPAKEVLP